MQEVLHDNKRALKHQLRAWELAFEEQNGGLVATHADKKRDLSYSQIKAEAKHVERALELEPWRCRGCRLHSMVWASRNLQADEGELKNDTQTNHSGTESQQGGGGIEKLYKQNDLRFQNQ